MSHKNWDYQVSCQDCGLTEMSRTRDIYRCRFCGSRDIDVYRDSRFDVTKFEEDEAEVEDGI